MVTVRSPAAALLLQLLAKPLLLTFGASANTIGYAVDYMRIYSLGTVFVQMTLGMNAYITAQGFTSVSMKTVVIGAVLNIILDPIFIFVFGMGVQGAALATILSQAVSCIWVLRFLTGPNTRWRLRRCYLRPRAAVATGRVVWIFRALSVRSRVETATAWTRPSAVMARTSLSIVYRSFPYSERKGKAAPPPHFPLIAVK